MAIETTFTIDGATETGWAAWSADLWEKTVYPIAAGIIVSKPADWIVKADYTISELRAVLLGRNATKAYIEWPAFHESEAGQLTASSGALVKLCIMVGRIYQLCEDLGIEPYPLEVRKWKGQCTKEITIRRIQRVLSDWKGLKGIKTHAWDAIGMGLYLKGVQEFQS